MIQWNDNKTKIEYKYSKGWDWLASNICIQNYNNGWFFFPIVFPSFIGLFTDV